MTCTVTFRGGPRDGQTKVYERDPITIGCVTEAHAAGMHGLYRTGGSLRARDCETAVATWTDMPRKEPV